MMQPHAGAESAQLRIAAACFLLALLTCASAAQAVQVQDLVRLKGAERSKLVGMGLVVGLDDTGDGGEFRPAMRALAQVIGRLIDPNVIAGELEDADNVALVALSAEIPPVGVREGDRVDVHVSSVGPAESLAGGRLFLIPMIGPLPGSPVYALAEGPITIEDFETPTTGVVEHGAQLTRDVFTRYLDDRGRMTLVINDTNASWTLAHNLASLINAMAGEDGATVAQAIDQKNVIVQMPERHRLNPAGFISRLLQTYIDPSQVGTAARVVINERTGTIVISGHVQISPAIISHEGLTINTLAAPALNGACCGAEADTTQREAQDAQAFIAVDPAARGGANLADLLAAFNQLKVQARDRIAILKLMHESGQLHAQLILE